MPIRLIETEAAGNSSIILDPLLYIIKCEALVVRLQLLTSDGCRKRLIEAVDPFTLVVVEVLNG